MQFGERWIGWLEHIFTSIRISILINGSPTKEFQPHRGLRPGDPLSPLLFLIVGEILHCLLEETSSLNIFTGITINASNGQNISHLQFADDTILFINNDLKSVMGIRRVLQCFEILSGLKINFKKSSLYGFNGRKADTKYWASRLGCRAGFPPITYLGMPLGLNPKRKDFWLPVIDKMKNGLALWKGKSLNQAGKLILIKSTLDSLPIYLFNMFLMPKQIQLEIDKIRRSFFWGDVLVGDGYCRKLHTQWDLLCRPKQASGINIASLYRRNVAMMGKWLWRL